MGVDILETPSQPVAGHSRTVPVIKLAHRLRLEGSLFQTRLDRKVGFSFGGTGV
jgi:hypothetical protein